MFTVSVSIRVVWDVFPESQLRFRVSGGGAGGFPLRVERGRGQGSQGVSRLDNVSLDFL